MTKHQQRVVQAHHFFDNHDIDLGFRKLLDCATDTQRMDIFVKALELTEWKENNPQAIEELVVRSKELLEAVAICEVEELSINKSVLIAKNIKKSYGMQRFSLGPVSVEIRKGQVYGLVGENGNGKTTLLRILAKELAHDEGELQFQFKEKSKNDYDLRTKLIYIPQRTEKWYGSLKDNLSFVLSNYKVAPEENEIRTLMMIARLGLWKYKHLKWSELSSGYKMRFELARTLLRQPEILLLDEPLANLDVLAQQVILEDLKAICNSVNNPIALILSSQQLYEVEKISDNVIFLKNGQYKDNLTSTEEEVSNKLIIEMDCAVDRDILAPILASIGMENLKYNGGLYVARFPDNVQFSDVLKAVGEAQLEIVYIRNISFSTRRFFVN